MSKKSFKSNLNDLFKENLHEIKPEETSQNSNPDFENIDEEKYQWLILKMQRYEKELKLWRTGVLTKEKFYESLQKSGLYYDEKSNKILKK